MISKQSSIVNLNADQMQLLDEGNFDLNGIDEDEFQDETLDEDEDDHDEGEQE
jgi:hypothetical protein